MGDGIYMVFNERRLISCRYQSFKGDYRKLTANRLSIRNHKYIMGEAGKLSRDTTKILQPPHRR